MLKIGKERAIFIGKKTFEQLIYDISLSENNEMSFLETASTLSGTIPEGVRSKDVILVENLKKGLEYIFYKLEQDDLVFDKNTLCMINRLVASNDNFDNLGGFRYGGIRIGGANHTGTPASEIDFEFSKIVNWYYSSNEEAKDIELFLKISKMQPFGDGNKRTAQILMCGLLMQNGYCPFTINFKDIKFSKPLVEFYDDELKKENIMNLMLDKQSESLRYFLTEKEIKEVRTRNNISL